MNNENEFRFNLGDDNCTYPDEEEDHVDSEGNISEAEEIHDELDEEILTQSDEGENLFGEDMERDYEPMPHLDHYDPSLLDETQQAPISPRARIRAEREMEERDRNTATVADRYYTGIESLLLPETEQRIPRSRTHQEVAASRPIPGQASEALEELPYWDASNKWTDRIEAILKIVLKGFIWEYNKDGSELSSQSDVGYYVYKIGDMVKDELRSLVINWYDMMQYSAKLADYFTYCPKDSIRVLIEVINDITTSIYPKLYGGLYVGLRITGHVGIQTIASLRNITLNQLVTVEGVCIRRSGVSPQIKVYYLECQKCGCDTNGPILTHNGTIHINRRCEDCQGKGPFVLSKGKSVYENIQKLSIQEPPSDIKPGRIPRYRRVIVSGDLVDCVKPGDEVIVTGIYQPVSSGLNIRSGFPIFNTEIEANNIEKKRDIRMLQLTDEDVSLIKRLACHKNIRSRIIDSIAPSIWGHRPVKAALASAMFGGVRRRGQGNHDIRGDINVLIMGDPGTAKSQFLKYTQQAFDRTVYTTGKGASAVGLTAAVKRDPMTREWSLEGGALVIADEGICLIDEFDKMNDKDRVSIHEVMEQQSVSISKAGIVTSLKARCSIIAAANPIFGKYDSSLPLSENVDLPDPILSRFDLICVVKDQCTAIENEYLADYILTSHINSHPDLPEMNDNNQYEHVGEIENTETIISGNGLIPHYILKKYIFYARRTCIPRIVTRESEILTDVYSELRAASINSGGMPMTVRHLESMIRMAYANAKMRLSNIVEKEDVHCAIEMMLDCFIMAQKHVVASTLNRRFGKYRAMSSVPADLIDRTIFDMIKLKEKNRKKEKREENEVKFTELCGLIYGLNNISKDVLYKYIQSDEFCMKFYIKNNELNEDEWLICQDSGILDVISQYSNEM